MSEGVTGRMGGNTEPGDGRQAWAVLCAHFSACRQTATDGTRKVVMGQANSREQPPNPHQKPDCYALAAIRTESHGHTLADDSFTLANILAGNGDTQIGTQGSHSDSGWQLRTQHTFSRTSGLREQDRGPRGAQPARTPLHGARSGAPGQHQKGQDGVRQARLHPFAHK